MEGEENQFTKGITKYHKNKVGKRFLFYLFDAERKSTQCIVLYAEKASIFWYFQDVPMVNLDVSTIEEIINILKRRLIN